MGKETSHHALPSAEQMAFGIVVTDSCNEHIGLLFEEAMRSLRGAGCLEHNIQIRTVYREMELSMAAQFFAEYTDVDAVILLDCLTDDSYSPELYLPHIYSIQMHWNMPCIWGRVNRYCTYDEIRREARELVNSAIRMVQMQLDMEAKSPNAVPDQRNLN